MPPSCAVRQPQPSSRLELIPAKMVEIWISFNLIFSMAICTEDSSTFSESYGKDRKFITGDVVDTVSLATDLACARHCVRRADCRSFNFEFPWCELIAESPQTGSISKRVGSVFFEQVHKKPIWNSSGLSLLKNILSGSGERPEELKACYPQIHVVTSLNADNETFISDGSGLWMLPSNLLEVPSSSSVTNLNLLGNFAAITYNFIQTIDSFDFQRQEKDGINFQLKWFIVLSTLHGQQLFCNTGDDWRIMCPGTWPRPIKSQFIGDKTLHHIDALLPHTPSLDSDGLWVFSDGYVYDVKVENDYHWKILATWPTVELTKEVSMDNPWSGAPSIVTSAAWYASAPNKTILFTREFFVIYDLQVRETVLKAGICL